MESDNILIVGLGNIGRRYLEGLANSRSDYTLHLLEKNKKKINELQEYLNKKKFNNQILVYSNPNLLPKKIYLSINSTTANCRVEVLKSIIKNRFIKFWIFEKPLGQSLSDINYFNKKLFKKNSWVNLPRTNFKHYKIIKNLLKNEKVVKLEVSGNNWGLCCNGIHFIYLFSWLLNSELKTIDFSKLNKWRKTKRKSFWEIDGILNLKFKNKIEGVLKATLNQKERKSCSLTIFTKKKKYFLNEITNKLFINGKLKMSGISKPLISNTISKTLIDLKKENKCNLPSVYSTLNHHSLFLKGLIKNWRVSSKSNKNIVPIT